MITLNDYLYSGDTVLKILQRYTEDLRKDAKKNRNEIDLIHCNFLIQIEELLEHEVFKGDAMRLDEAQAVICAVVSAPEPVLPTRPMIVSVAKVQV